MENFRIIIVANFHDDTDKGILKILNNGKSDFLLDYLYEIVTIEETDDDPESTSFNPKINAENPFLYLSNKEIAYNQFEDWQVLLISDRLATGNYPSNVFDTNTLIMFHTLPNDISEFLKNKTIKFKKQGQHEPGNQNGFPIINFFADAYDGSFKGFDETKYNLGIKYLIEWFDVDEKLEAKLVLLNKIVNNTNPKILDKLIAKHQTSFENFGIYNWEDQFSTDFETFKNYEIAYEKFRDSLGIE